MASILNTTTLDADARLINWEGQPQDAGFKLTRGWPWIAGYGGDTGGTVRELVNALNATTSYTTPKANGRAYSGKFIASENRAADESVDGRAGRDCNIVQTLTKVKTTLTNIDNLGTPDKDADKKTLNFLGFKEGEQAHIYYRYRNLDPAERTNAMAVTLPTESGYTVVKREFTTEKDKTGTLYVVYEDDDWIKGSIDGAVWGNNTEVSSDTKGRVRVGYTNYDENRNLTGHGMGENYQLTGISKGVMDTNWIAAQQSDTDARVITNVGRSERANGEYAINQKQRIAYQGTAYGDALVVGYTDSLGSQVPAIRRVWFRRTDTAKDALVAVGGRARGNDTFNGFTYYQDQTDVSDHGDGTFTVTQNLKNLGVGYGVLATYFTDSFSEVKVFTRSKDDAIKKVYYWKFVSVKTSEKSAVNFISGKATASISGGIVPGSDHVVKKAPFYYVATCKIPQASAGAPKIDAWA